MQAWTTDNDGLNKEFDDVISCDEHSNAASVNIRPPGDEWPTATGVVSFTNCTVAEGKTVP